MLYFSHYKPEDLFLIIETQKRNQTNSLLYNLYLFSLKLANAIKDFSDLNHTFLSFFLFCLLKQTDFPMRVNVKNEYQHVL